jgi:DNA-binding response OmpR family regulator
MGEQNKERSCTMNKVLIIDDDKELCALMKKCIEQEKLSAVTVYNGIEGVRLIDENKDSYSLIILDVMLPDIDGFQILQKIRDKSNIPVLMLTAKSSEEDKVFGLRLGADDYLTKPFGINELLARVNSLIRRYTTLNPFTADIDSISLKDMVIDKLNRTVTVKDIPVLLTGKEFDLLLFLASNKGRVFTKKQIYSQVWEEEYAFDDSNIMSFISKLRKKIEPDPDHPFYILTVRGVGYRFNKEA